MLPSPIFQLCKAISEPLQTFGVPCSKLGQVHQSPLCTLFPRVAAQPLIECIGARKLTPPVKWLDSHW